MSKPGIRSLSSVWNDKASLVYSNHGRGAYQLSFGSFRRSYLWRLLSEISSLATARLVGYGIIAHQSSFSIRAVILTTLGF